jgi:hypothetical protein
MRKLIYIFLLLSAVAYAQSSIILPETKDREVKAQDSFSIDAFGRWRVSEPFTLFDSKQLTDSAALFWDDQETDSSISEYVDNYAATKMKVADTTLGTRTRQTKMRFNYQPGKSQLILLTFSNIKSKAGITKQAGYFDDRNGIFLESRNDSVFVVRRTYVTGSAVDNEVYQTSWNLDTMKGTGTSGVTLDFTKTQIFLIDLEWLGVGRVRCGFVVDGFIYYVHEFNNANSLSTVYMSTPNLPLRYAISNDSTAMADSMYHICSSVISEGGQQENGVLRYKSTEGTNQNADVENTLYSVLGIKLKSTHLGSVVKLVNVALQVHTASSKCEWVLLLNPTIAGAKTWADETNSAVQTFAGVTANTVTGGYAITGGFVETGGVAAGGAGSVQSSIQNAIYLGSTIAGVSDSIVVAVRPIGGSTLVDVEGALTWRELQ